jgi:hypothetical protein
MAAFDPGAYFPHSLRAGWLGPEMSSDLLDYAQASKDRFVPAAVRKNGLPVIDPGKRISFTLRDLGPFSAALQSKAMALAPELCIRFGNGGFAPEFVELELAAHGDGAFYGKHQDTLTGATGLSTRRQITMVYYLFRQPKRFTGGQLRYHSIGGAAFQDFEPEHDLLLAFPSIAPHSVQRVNCPGAPFADWRFAVNIWIHGL